MNVYQVKFKDNKAISAKQDESFEHGDMKFVVPDEKVEWYAIECSDRQTAIEIAEMVVNTIWGGTTCV